ncbi:VIT1/CCC1 transporter family protein [Chitinophaga lutea]
MADKGEKAIRSSGWTTDMLIGFPDGLLLLLFTTQVLHGKGLTVGGFYNLHWLILGVCTLLMMIAVFRANRGDGDEGVMTPDEEKKLKNLDISRPTIEQIAIEMERDQQLWEKTLADEKVELRSFGLRHALRSMMATGVFFLAGGLTAFFPYLANEDFTAASRTSLVLSITGLLIFAILKSRITGQGAIRVTMRYIVTGALVLLASYLISLAI